MKDAVLQWFNGRVSPPGLLACGLRQPDGNFACRSVEASCPVPRMEKVLAQFASLRAALFSDALAPRWSTWEFEHGQVRYVERADGWLLGVVVGAGAEAMPGLDQLSQEFLSLQLGL